LDIATARIEASSSPARPVGISRIRNNGRMRFRPLSRGQQRRVLRKHKKRHAHQQKNRELKTTQ